MRRLSKNLRGSSVWNFAIYVQEEPLSTESRLHQPTKLFSSRRLKLTSKYPRDQADPFLIVHEGALHILYEKLMHRSVGTIACFRTTDLQNFEDLGVVLAEPHHLSYPYVFHDGDDVLLLPEASQSGEVPLYTFTRFPFGPHKTRTLLRGAYVDSFLISRNGLWYLFTTSKDGLEIFFAEDLRTGEFSAHPLNPVVPGQRYSRNGGGPLRIGNSLVRVAQDHSLTYGGNVSLFEIVALSPDRYEERLVRSDFFETGDRWNALGAHHLSVTTFEGQTVTAVDGKCQDYIANKLFSRLFWR